MKKPTKRRKDNNNIKENRLFNNNDGHDIERNRANKEINDDISNPNVETK